MRKIIFGSLAIIIYAPLSMAGIHPVVSVAGGILQQHANMKETITLISPFQNTYLGKINSTPATGGLFLGVEKQLVDKLSLQLGGSYYVNDGIKVNGVIYQFNDPALNDLNYQYKIQSQRVLIEGKFLTSIRTTYHPYISLGIGKAWNKASDYLEISTMPGTLPMSPGFSNNTTCTTATMVGAGIEKDINSNFRLGFMYRWLELNSASLGTSLAQDTTMTLKNHHLNGNEFLIQLSYIG